MNVASKIFSEYNDQNEASYKNEPFGIVKIKGNFYPCGLNAKEVFIYGVGYKRIDKSKIIQTDRLTELDEIKQYFDLYGADCLYYNLTNKLIGNNDYCWNSIQREFEAMTYAGFINWFNYIGRINKLIAETTSIYLTKWGINPYVDKVQTTKNGNVIFRQDLFKIKLNHFVSYPFGRTLPFLDCIEDDSRLFNTYYYCECGETDLEKNKLPSSVKDRLTYLFNENVANEYELLMHLKK